MALNSARSWSVLMLSSITLIPFAISAMSLSSAALLLDTDFSSLTRIMLRATRAMSTLR